MNLSQFGLDKGYAGINEMAYLAQQAAALPPIVIPVVAGTAPAYAVCDDKRPSLPEKWSRTSWTGSDQRRLKPTKSDPALVPCGLDIVEFLHGRAKGFSQNTCLPARKARAAKRACESWGVAITTTSTSGSSITASAPDTARSKPDPLGQAAGREA